MEPSRVLLSVRLNPEGRQGSGDGERDRGEVRWHQVDSRARWGSRLPRALCTLRKETRRKGPGGSPRRECPQMSNDQQRVDEEAKEGACDSGLLAAGGWPSAGRWVPGGGAGQIQRCWGYAAVKGSNAAARSQGHSCRDRGEVPWGWEGGENQPGQRASSISGSEGGRTACP